MKKSVKWIALLCLMSLLLQACGSKKTEEPATVDPSETTSETNAVTPPEVVLSEPKSVTLTEAELEDKIAGGWIGQMVGVAWSASTEFCYAGQIMPESSMPKWTPSMINNAFGQDDLYVEIPFLDAMKENGAFCDPSYMAEKFRDSKFALWHANGMGRENLLNGIPYPISGNYEYNYHADDIDWQIEADFLGMMYPGMVNAAAERAFEIGHIMNYGDGVYGGVFVSAMHAAAFTADSIEEIWKAGIAVIPEGTEFRELLEDVVESYEAGDTFEQNWQKLEQKWTPYDLCPELPGKSNIDAKLNSGYILLGLLYGEGDINKTIILSTRCGQDSDCNPSSAASILGNYYGASGLPSNYAEALDYTGTNFSYTEYNFLETVNLNLSLTNQVLAESGAEKNAEGDWVVKADTSYKTVAFEQWPDGVFAYLNLKTTGNTVIFAELTPYSKNETITGYKIDMGDGFVFDDVTPATYTYAKGGTYTVTVTVTGDKGSVKEVKKIVKATSASSTVSPTIIVCSVTNPAGGGSRDMGVICDGVIPKAGSANDKMQYDTYTLGDPHGDPDTPVYIGYVYREKQTVSQVIFTEGNHFGNGGWFKDGSLKVELLIDGKWQVLDYTTSPEYPNGNTAGKFGAAYQTYTFTFDSPVECTGVRLNGIAGGSAGFISVSELQVK